MCLLRYCKLTQLTLIIEVLKIGIADVSCIVGRSFQHEHSFVLILNDIQLLALFQTYFKTKLFDMAYNEHRERKCADKIGTVPVPWSGHFQRKNIFIFLK